MSFRLCLGNAVAFLLPLCGSLAQTPDFATINQAFGVPLWADNNLWDDPDAGAAGRLHWRAESRTTTDSSFRRYAGPDERLLGARPFSLALYGKDGKVSQLSMIFANKGDLGKADDRRPLYKAQITADAKAIREALTKALGPAKVTQFGEGSRTRERVERWDWDGHSILLAAPRGEYVAVRIVPTTVADGEVTAKAVTGVDLRAALKDRVEHRPNGDVILRDIPMVDQGPKGYCVPATWERALRYMGIPADMYVLAMAGQTSAGGGTNVQSMMAGAKEVVSRNGHWLETRSGRISPQTVSRFIDAGRPVMWTMFVVDSLHKNITYRSAQRRTVTDWTTYKEMLKPWRKAALRLRTSPENGHMCMIIGYNVATNEIAISDSWGPEFAERWITEEEANAISQGSLTVVN
jgi:hypothetical protein